jgi:predicted DNA-binding transcriptional regulator AlpA
MSIKYEETLRMLKNMFPQKVLLTVEDVSGVVGLSTGSIYNRVRPNSKGKPFIKTTRVSWHLRFHISDVARFIASGL